MWLWPESNYESRKLFMKLHDGFITYNSGSEQIMVAAGAASDVFRGMVRSNSTAAFIIDCLKTEISLDELTEKLVERYDAPREIIVRDLEKILQSLRKIGALDE